MYSIEAAEECEVLSILDKLFEDWGAIAFELRIDQVKEATAVADPSPYSPQTGLKIYFINHLLELVLRSQTDILE